MVRQFTEFLESMLARLNGKAGSCSAPPSELSEEGVEPNGDAGGDAQSGSQASGGLVWGPGQQERARRYEAQSPSLA